MFKTTETPMRVLDFDIENRPSSYWYDGRCTAEITAIAWSAVGDEVVRYFLLHSDDTYEDEEGMRWPAAKALQAFADVARSADMLTGHYIRKHDLPILNGALLERGLAPLRATLTQDTKLDLVRRADLSVSQEALAEMMGVREEKYTMTQGRWRSANRLTAEGIAAAKKRVVDDVIMHKKMRAELIRRGLLNPPRYWRP